MNITLDIKKPSDNTNTDHGDINIKIKGSFAYISISKFQGQDIVVNADELYRAINALYRG